MGFNSGFKGLEEILICIFEIYKSSTKYLALCSSVVSSSYFTAEVSVLSALLYKTPHSSGPLYRVLATGSHFSLRQMSWD